MANFMIGKAARYLAKQEKKLTKQEKILISLVLLILLSGAAAQRFLLEKPQQLQVPDEETTKGADDANGEFRRKG